MAGMIHRYVLVLACVASMAACTQPAAPVAPATPEPPTAEAGAPEAGAPAAAAHDAPPQVPQTQACIIAGEFNVLGKTIRSRDCVQSTGTSSDTELKKICEGLANTSAQMGGTAGQVTYMKACPSPSQGSCKRLFGLAFDGYYYARSAEDLAGLPDSCTQGGGSWSAG
ncbi:hypothetical protein KQ945_12560 [Bacillus subtilis subsp. subtilis]|nr:hypothetical protein [Bacillus subtilis subsp. subtilis]